MPRNDPSIEIEWIGGNCPVQAEGKIGNKNFYFRARWLKWSMSIDEKDPLKDSPEWYMEESYGETEGDAGWMPQYDAIIMMGRAFKAYCESMK